MSNYSSNRYALSNEDRLIMFYKELERKLINNNSMIIDPYDTTGLLAVKHYNSRELNKIYAHLLNYTYAATALEVKNHEVVNKHLQDIHNLLIKLVKENPNLIKTPEGQVPSVLQ
jgi:hypothetical protein